MSLRKDMQSLLRECERQGAEVTHTNGGHWRVRSPHGQLVFVSDSPSDQRAIRGARSDLRKAGINC